MKKILAICTLILLPNLSCASQIPDDQIPDDIKAFYGAGLPQVCAAIHKGAKVMTLIPVETFKEGKPVTRYQLSAASLDVLRDQLFQDVYILTNMFEDFDKFDARKKAARKVYQQLYPHNTPIDLVLSWFRAPIRPKVTHDSVR